MDVDHLERRCPRLGGDVAFGYCRICGADRSACFKILDCWWERFDVAAHMRSCLTPAAYAALVDRRPPPSKVSSLVDLIQQARERTGQK